MRLDPSERTLKCTCSHLCEDECDHAVDHHIMHDRCNLIARVCKKTGVKCRCVPNDASSISVSDIDPYSPSYLNLFG